MGHTIDQEIVAVHGSPCAINSLILILIGKLITSLAPPLIALKPILYFLRCVHTDVQGF
jgi:hypothetical protein